MKNRARGLAAFALAGAFAWVFPSCESVDDAGALVPPTVDQDPALPRVAVRVAGKERLIHVREFGLPSNPPLLFLHGSYSDSRAYRNICDSLADRYHVVIWDQRGAGLSERIPAEEFTLASTVEEVSAMQAIYASDRKATLIGHSWGGGVASAYTAAHPEAVEQLVLMEPIPLTGADMQEVYSTIIRFRYDDPVWNSLARHGQTLGSRNHAQIDYRARMILRSAMTAGYHCKDRAPPDWPVHRVGGYLEWVRNQRLGNPLSGFTYDFTSGLPAFAAETLILGGACSSLGFAMQEKYTRPHFPASRVAEIQDAGHRMTIERPAAVMAALRGYLNAYR